MGINIETIINTPVSSNCYVISSNVCPSHCIIIDPGTPSCKNLNDYLVENQLYPDYVILTHEHFDHIAGVPALRQRYNFKLVSSHECSKAIQNAKSNLSFYRDGIGFILESADIEIDDCSLLEWNGFICKAYVARGHSAGGILVEIENNIFTGDTLIWGNKTVTKLPTGSKDDLKYSFDLLKALSYQKNMHVYAGHGRDFYLNDYKWNEI